MIRLFRFSGKYKLYLFLAPLMIIGEVTMETFIPQLTARLINLINDAETMPLEMSQVLLLGGQMVLMSILSLGFGAPPRPALPLSGRWVFQGTCGIRCSKKRRVFLSRTSINSAPRPW